MRLNLKEAFNNWNELKTNYWKYVDDITVGEEIKLKDFEERGANKLLKLTITYHYRTN